MKTKSSIESGRVERLDWLDILKFLVMWLVVVGHASSIKTPESYRFYLYSFHMPLFFMISGGAFYLQNRKRDFNFIELVKNKTKGLVGPYFMLSIMALPIWYLNFKILKDSSTSIKEIVFGIFYSNEDVVSSSTNAAWFILALFLTNIVFFWLLKWCRNNNQLVLLYAAVLCSFGYAMSIENIKFIPPWHIDTVPVAVLFFTIGYILIQYKENLFDFLGSKLRQVIFVIILFPIAFCCARFNDKISMSANNYGSFLLFMGAVFGFSGICLIIARNLPNLKIFKFIGRNTIVILAFHSPILRFLMHFSEITAYWKEYHPIITGTLVFIAMIPVCYIFERWLPFLIGRKKKVK